MSTLNRLSVLAAAAKEQSVTAEQASSNLVNAMLTKDVRTDNGALTNSTSLNKCLDLFFLAGGCRNLEDQELINLFSEAFGEDQETALRILLWARDVRGGAGERRFFRVISEWLSESSPELSAKLTELIPEYGRWDDVFYGDEKTALSMISEALQDGNQLCAKWMPRKGPLARQIREYMQLKEKPWRKMLVEASDTVEQVMSKKQWADIEYKTLPSVAFKKYVKAFERNDPERFSAFIGAVEKGEEKISAGAIFPHDIVTQISRERDSQAARALQAQWGNLPDYVNEGDSFIPVCDVSGSMTGLPMAVSISLGIYLSERNKSVFKDAFITFSQDPQMNLLKGGLKEKVDQLRRADWGMNTDIASVFDLIADQAASGKVTAEDMPGAIMIISDMEFDYADDEFDMTALDYARKKFEGIGLPCPKIVFWNVNGRVGNVPANKFDDGVALVSGFSPAIMKSVLGGKDFTPVGVMNNIIGQERYDAAAKLLE